ncbi:MAG: NAD(P)H-dependent oxidoreductase [Saprospiraceae bacterium]
MPHIAIISASIRRGRNSHRVALFFKNFVEVKKLATAEILDLKEYNFPLFDERLHHQENPTPEMLDFADKIKSADGVLIVTPEYNGGYPAALKNVIDLLETEWRRKPIAIATASDGDFAGTQVIISVQWSLWKLRSWTIPARFHVPKVQHAYDESGIPSDKPLTEKLASGFINELLWCIEAKRRMETE